MEIIIKTSKYTTQHKYIEDEEKAIEFYKQAIETYGKENVEISGSLSKFYI